MRPAELTLRREDGRVVCESVRVADTTLRRLRGLLGRRSLPRGQGMLLRPAFSIHTWFMQFPIDVVFLDPEQVVIKIAPAVPPFKTVGCRGAREVIELAAGECERRALSLGDRVAWAAKSSWEHTPGTTALAGPSVRTPSAEVAVVSADPRFSKLARFLLENRELSVRVVAPADAAVTLEGERIGAIVVDTGTDLPEGLRLVSGIRAATTAPIVLAREDGASGPVPGGFPSFHKWDDTEPLVASVASVASPNAARQG